MVGTFPPRPTWGIDNRAGADFSGLRAFAASRREAERAPASLEWMTLRVRPCGRARFLLATDFKSYPLTHDSISHITS